MKWKVLAALTLAAIFNSVAAFDYTAAPEQSYFSSALWRNRDQFLVDEKGLDLSEDTIIKVDEVILNGPLVTNGHSLRIDALQITFGSAGSIRGFRQAALSGAARDTGATGKRSTSTQGTGGNGVTPIPADPGVDGMQAPAAMVIYASRIVGTAVIDGTGQTGGQGGHGGKGGKGGTGGPGRNGHAHCGQFIFGRDSATDGGQGGQGAPGGDGGIGGRGGAPVPIVFVSGESQPANTKIIQGPGESGKGGDPGDPGAAGDGGPGGNDDTASCGVWPVEWSESVSGGDPGPPGPAQTQAGKAGGSGPTAPALDFNRDPQPTFAALVNGKPGPIVADLSELEARRDDLVQAWSIFHWARNFLFLTLDTLSEVQTENQRVALTATGLSGGQAQGDLLAGILAATDNERVSQLKDLWTNNLLTPLQGMTLAQNSPLIGATDAATAVVGLLDQLAPQKAVDPILLTQLERVRSGAQAQMTSALANAVEACTIYMQTKQKQLAAVLTLTSTYSVPVCEADPDFRLPENVDKAIAFFRPIHGSVPDLLKANYQQLAWLQILPRAHADGFDVTDVTNTNVAPANVQARLPDRGVWVKDGLGVFTGFPALQRAQSIAEVGQGLYYLQQNLIRIKSR